MALCIPAVSLAVDGNAVPSNITSANVKKAAKEYGISDNQIMIASSSSVESVLADAGSRGANGEFIMVYAASGTYKVSKLVVPKNVVLVADENAKFTAADSNEMLIVRGSLYGGTYTQGSSKYAVLCYQQSYTGKNGRIEYAKIAGNLKGKAAICANACKNVSVTGCTVTGGMNGIQITKGTNAKTITKNKVSNCGSGAAGSGIDIHPSTIGVISNNTVSGCRGHGISTGTSAASNAQINIKQISNNTLKNNNKQGIYVEGNTHIEKLTGNTITGNGTGLAMRSNVHSSNGKYSSKHFNTYVKNVKSNKFVANKGSNVSVIGKMAKFYLVSGNQLNSSKNGCGLALSEGAAVAVTGTNKFNGNKTSGVIIQSKARLTVKGANCQFLANKRSGLSVDHGKAYITGSGSTFSRNTQHGISLTTGGLVRITAKNVKILKNHNGVNATGSGASFTSIGTGVVIGSNRNHGISLNKKAKGYIKNTKFSSNKRFGVYVGKGCSMKYINTNLPKLKRGVARG